MCKRLVKVVNSVYSFQFDCCGYMSRDDWNVTGGFLMATGMFPGSCNCSIDQQNNTEVVINLSLSLSLSLSHSYFQQHNLARHDLQFYL